MSICIESSFSFNGSLITNKSLDNLSDLGYKTLGLVDNTTAFFLTFYKRMKEQGIKPLLGLRLKDKYFDIILYPINFIGYKEVLKYSSNRNKTPYIEYESLIKSKNIIYVIDSTYLENDNLMYLNNVYNGLKDEDLKVYIGLDFSYYPVEVQLYPLIKGKYDIIITNIVKYIDKDDKKASEVLEAILSGSEVKDANLFDMGRVSSYHLRNYLEFTNEYKDYPELLKSTLDFIDLIDIEIEFGYHFPKYETRGNVPSSVYLKALSKKGLSKRLENTNKNYKRYESRLNYELEIIDKMGFNDYFLVVYDYILYAKKNNIYVGPGRGSGASSLVSYSLGIIDIDPLEYNLYFERFLNPYRKSMPDIDTDFEDTKRDDVIKYCISKYGSDHVSLITSYQTLLAKGAVRDVAKALGINDLKVNAILKEIQSDDNTIESLLKKKIITNYYNNDNEIKELLDISRRIEGIPKSTGIHASAVIISDDDINNYSETKVGTTGFIQTVYDADSIKDIGLVKMDFLSLRTLSTIHEIVDEINENRNINLDINKINLEDEKTFNLFNSKPITGIFQFETKGMTDLIKKIKPTSFSDLSIATALYRPGSIGYSEEYINRKNKLNRVEYYDPCLKDILSETLGIIVYQEQIMSIINVYSGLSLAEADILRRAISAKDEKILLELKDKFYKGATIKNRNKLVTEKLFSDILKFSGYGFNKSHSVAYSKVSYIEAFLKANYPQEFMANLLKTSNGSKIIKECSSFNLKVLSPDVRFSSYKYKIVKNSLIMPFSVIKGVGVDYAKEIEKIVRPSGPNQNTFESIISRAKGVLPRNLIEDLIFSNAFDYTGYNKKTMIEALDGLYEFDPTVVRGLNYKIKILEEYPFEYLKNRELELLGFNPKYHPLSRYTGDLKKISDIETGIEGITIIAYLSDLKMMKTKSGDMMANFILEDEYKQTRGVLFPSDYYKYARELSNNTIYEVFGSYSLNRGEPQFVVRNLKKIDNV